MFISLKISLLSVSVVSLSVHSLSRFRIFWCGISFSMRMCTVIIAVVDFSLCFVNNKRKNKKNCSKIDTRHKIAFHCLPYQRQQRARVYFSAIYISEITNNIFLLFLNLSLRLFSIQFQSIRRNVLLMFSCWAAFKWFRRMRFVIAKKMWKK